MNTRRLGPSRAVTTVLAFVVFLAACVSDSGNADLTLDGSSNSTPTTAAQVVSTTTAAVTSTTTPCIGSGDHLAIQSVLTTVGSEAVLCPNSVFELGATIEITAADQKVYTQGLPTDDSRALLRVSSRDIATALQAGNHDGAELRNVIVDGNQAELGEGPTGALIDWGGGSSGHIVEWVKGYEPRGWTVLYLGEGDGHRCTRATARYNELGPAGDHIFGMADGISLACRDSIVEHNTIVDATDGGIVIFQATGSLVANNNIISRTRVAYYGISMEDYGPFDGDFTGTRVIDNVINAEGAMIRRGLAMGPRLGCTGPDHPPLVSRGALVSGNTLMGIHMGYGFLLGGVEDWTVTDNIDLSTHLVPPRETDCFGDAVDPPAGFQMNSTNSAGTFQEEFEAATLGFTTDWWPNQAVVSVECLSDLIGAELVDDLRYGRAGEIWPALEAADDAEFLVSCMTVYEPPLGENAPGMIQLLVAPCEPYCGVVEMINASDDSADMSNAEFILQDFQVECDGLPDLIEPWGSAQCTIEDFVADGFQTLWFYGFPPGGQHWGFNYPFE